MKKQETNITVLCNLLTILKALKTQIDVKMDLLLARTNNFRVICSSKIIFLKAINLFLKGAISVLQEAVYLRKSWLANIMVSKIEVLIEQHILEKF